MQMLHLDSVTRRMLLPLVLASIAMLLGVLATLLHVRAQAVQAAGIATAKALASQIVNLRRFYTAEIAARATQAGMRLNFDFDQSTHTLPLPATLVKALGKTIEQEYPGMAIRLYSHYPFPNRAATEHYDDFETRAMDALLAAPEQPQSTIDRQGGRPVLRYVVADRMQAGCVACHNARVDSPRKDWKVGDVRGAIEVTVPIGQIGSEIDRGIVQVGLVVLAGIFALGSVATFATRRAAGALHQLNLELENHVEARTADLLRANAKLHEALHHIERSEPLAALGAMIAGMAHELNTPMGNATLLVSALTEQVNKLGSTLSGNQVRRSELTNFVQTAGEACAMLQRNVFRASELVADFKQVSADQTSLRRREFDLAELIAETLHTIAPTYKHKPVSVRTEVPTGIRLDSFPGALEQVITNLVNNAVLHGLDEHYALTITITAELLADGSQVKLTVRDNGRGMSADVVARAFQAFFTTRLGRGGTGLGLHLVNKLVHETLAGRLTLHSQPGQGTCFEIVLPRVAPPSDAGSGASGQA